MGCAVSTGQVASTTQHSAEENATTKLSKGLPQHNHNKENTSNNSFSDNEDNITSNNKPENINNPTNLEEEDEEIFTENPLDLHQVLPLGSTSATRSTTSTSNTIEGKEGGGGVEPFSTKKRRSTAVSTDFKSIFTEKELNDAETRRRSRLRLEDGPLRGQQQRSGRTGGSVSSASSSSQRQPKEAVAIGGGTNRGGRPVVVSPSCLPLDGSQFFYPLGSSHPCSPTGRNNEEPHPLRHQPDGGPLNSGVWEEEEGISGLQEEERRRDCDGGYPISVISESSFESEFSAPKVLSVASFGHGQEGRGTVDSAHGTFLISLSSPADAGLT